MRVCSVVSTKGGVGKTTIAANLGGFLADAGLSVLMLDLDIQPTLSSYYKLEYVAECGCYELIAFNEERMNYLTTRTAIDNLDLIYSNDDTGQLATLLLHAADGRFRLRNLLALFEPCYDVLLIDTQGARSILVEMAILASQILISPVTPEVLAAREFRRGTLQLMQDIAPFRDLGIRLPALTMLINRLPTVSSSARMVHQSLQEAFHDQPGIVVARTVIPAIEAYPQASARALPVHRIERTRPSGRTAPAALETMRALATEIFPVWKDRFDRVSGKGALQDAY